jgi:pimeloyl-ACP methyl ester carboxylesterase
LGRRLRLRRLDPRAAQPGLSRDRRGEPAARARRRRGVPRRAPADVEGPIILVAHSYGGAVISNAATGNDQVKALVFLAGWALDEGESIEQLLGLNEGSLVLPALRQVPFTNPDGSEGLDLY